MKPLLLLSLLFLSLALLVLMPLPGFAQMTPYHPVTANTHSQDPSEGLYGGLSAGWYHYKTYWYYYNSGGNPRHDNNAVHSINRAVVSANLEKRSRWRTGSFRFDLGGELQLGLAGKAKGIWLPNDDVISSGGWSAGLLGYVRAVYVPASGTSGLHIQPFVSMGPQFMLLHNNGKGTGPFASESYYAYTDGWNEYLLNLVASLGVEFQLADFVLAPEIRLGLLGTGFTSWGPRGSGVSTDGMPEFAGFSVRLSKRF